MLHIPLFRSLHVTKATFVDVVSMFFVSFLSLLLLVYVGVGEGQRTYAGFLSGKMAAQGEIIQNAMASHVQAGLPLRQFVGFQTMTTQIIESDETLALIVVTDRFNKAIFTQQKYNTGSPDHFEKWFDPKLGEKFYSNNRFEVRVNNAYYVVILPLRSKFETVGSLLVLMPKQVVQSAVNVALIPVIAFIALLSIAFSAFISKSKDSSKRNRLQDIGLSVCFMVTTVVVVSLLVALYSQGAQSKAKALAYSLSERIGSLAECRVSLEDVEGIEDAFMEYRARNSDIQAIGLLRNGKYIIHTDPSKLGSSFQKTPGTFEFVVEMVQDATGNKQSVYVSLPKKVVYSAVQRNATNFIVLFFATAFLAALFLQLANAIQRNYGVKLSREALSESALEKCKPVLFLAVFVDNLSASFLPQLIRGYADVVHAPPLMASVAFMAHFICFALILVPAGKLAQRIGPKPLLWGGAILVALGLGLLATTGSFALLVVARILSGLGQGTLFIGVQALVLTAATGVSNQNKANGIIVYNFNAGMMSGMVIGSLLALYMGSQGVFAFGLICILALAAYVYAVIPVVPATQEDCNTESTGGMWQVIRNAEFLRVILCVGIPAKAVMTGLIIFGLPIVLSNMACESDEIGQIIMFYAIGVLLANRLASGIENVKPETMLSAGMLTASAGLLFIGVFGVLDPAWTASHLALRTICMVLGVLAVGLGHGAINAPVVTYMANSSVSRRMGVVNTTSVYRVLERVGHVMGPMIVGQLLVVSGQSVLTVGWIGAAMLVLTVIFYTGLKSVKPATDKP